LDNNSLWSKYCGFFEKDYNEQIKYNEEMLERHLEAWNRTKTQKMIVKDGGSKNIDNLPLTEYEDYRVLLEFRENLYEKEKGKTKEEGELWYDYYSKLLGDLSYIVQDYLPDTPKMFAKTSGTTGPPKFIVHGQGFDNQIFEDSVALVLMGCSKAWGESVFDESSYALNLFAPVPYLTGWTVKYWENLINFVPPISYTDNTMDMGKKFKTAFTMIEQGKKIQLAGGSGALFYMIAKYFSDPEYFLEESLRQSQSTQKRALIRLGLLAAKLRSRKKLNLREIMPLKGLIIASADAHIYSDFIKEEFDIEPFSVYASTELGCAMFGRPDKKLNYFPNLRSAYLEFLDENGDIKKLNELKRGKVYELIATPFYSMFVRYRIKDLFKFVGNLDGFPFFSFEGRTENVLDIYNYYRVTEDTMARAIVGAGFKARDRWVVAKSFKPKEMLEVYFEREWPVSERQAEKLIFNSLLTILPEFQRYVQDFKILNPSDAIRVEFLKKGTFIRYTIEQVRKKVPLGQYKPLKIIPSDKGYMIEELKEYSK
jgi:hypothetical protein